MFWVMSGDPGSVPCGGAAAPPQRASFGSVLAAGYQRDSKGVTATPMRVLGHYAVVFLAGGSGRYQLRDREPWPCRAGDLLVVFPDIPHCYGPGAGEFWREYYLVFDGEVFDLWRSRGLLSPDRPVLRPPFFAGALREIRALVRSAGRPDMLLSESLPLVCRLQQFLARAVRGRGAADSGLPVWARLGVTALGSLPPATPAAAARAAGMSYESFRKKFRALFGESPLAWSQRRIIERARRLMYEERLGNKEIAERLGFCDEFHFSKRFRRITGQTPSEARRALAGRSSSARSARPGARVRRPHSA